MLIQKHALKPAAHNPKRDSQWDYSSVNWKRHDSKTDTFDVRHVAC